MPRAAAAARIGAIGPVRGEPSGVSRGVTVHNPAAYAARLATDKKSEKLLLHPFASHAISLPSQSTTESRQHGAGAPRGFPVRATPDRGCGAIGPAGNRRASHGRGVGDIFPRSGSWESGANAPYSQCSPR